MVKIPGLNNLKKIGTDLIDSAKTVDLGGVVDKFKTGIDSVTKKNGSGMNLGEDPLGKLLQDAVATLNELVSANAAQAEAIKKMRNQMIDIAKMAATYQKPSTPPTQKPESDNS